MRKLKIISTWRWKDIIPFGCKRRQQREKYIHFANKWNRKLSEISGDFQISRQISGDALYIYQMKEGMEMTRRAYADRISNDLHLGMSYIGEHIYTAERTSFFDWENKWWKMDMVYAVYRLHTHELLFDDILELQTVNGELERPQSERAMRGRYISLILCCIAQATIREISIIIEEWIVLYKRKDDLSAGFWILIKNLAKYVFPLLVEAHHQKIPTNSCASFKRELPKKLHVYIDFVD